MSIQEVAKRLREYVEDFSVTPAKRPKESHIDSFMDIGKPVVSLSELHEQGVAMLRRSTDATASLSIGGSVMKIGVEDKTVIPGAVEPSPITGLKEHPEFKFLELLTGFYKKKDPLELLNPFTSSDQSLKERADTLRSRLTQVRTELRASLELLGETTDDLQQMLRDLQRVSSSNRFIDDARKLSALYDTYHQKILNLDTEKPASKIWVDVINLFTNPTLSGVKPGSLVGTIANPSNKVSPTFKEVSSSALDLAKAMRDGRSVRNEIRNLGETEKPSEADVSFLLKYIFYHLMYSTPIFIDEKSKALPDTGLLNDRRGRGGVVDLTFEQQFSRIDAVKDLNLNSKTEGTPTRVGGGKARGKPTERKLSDVTITTDPESFVKALNTTDASLLSPSELDTRLVIDAFRTKISEIARVAVVTDVDGKTAAEIELDLEEVEREAQELIDSLASDSPAKKMIDIKLRDASTATYPATIAIKGWLTDFTDTLETPLMGSTKDNIGKIAGLTEVVKEKQEMVTSLVNEISDVTSRMVLRVDNKKSLPYLPGVEAAIAGCLGILTDMYKRKHFTVNDRTRRRILTERSFYEPFAQAVANFLFVYINDIKFPTVWRSVNTASDTALNQIGSPLTQIGKRIDSDGFLITA